MNYQNERMVHADKEAMEYLVSIGANAKEQEGKPVIEEINGEKYLFFGGEWCRIEPVHPEEEPAPEPFVAYTLQGLVDFIKADVDNLFKDHENVCTVKVCSPTKVQILSPLLGNWKRRRLVFAECIASVPDIAFGKFLEPDSFQVMLQTKFLETDNRGLVLKLSGSLRKEQSMDIADDGVSQRLTVNTGVATAANVTVKNPVELFPMRTFCEVEQPSSLFVLRFNDKAEAALFDGDGGAWRVKAVENIKNWLRFQLQGVNVEVIA